MAIVHRSMHDAIHAVREQHGRAVTRSLLTQQRTLAANKLQCNAQMKRTSTPDPPSMSNVPSRRARARSEKANDVTSSSSEESDCKPQTARKAQFEALKSKSDQVRRGNSITQCTSEKAKTISYTLLPKCQRLPIRK